MLNLFRIIKIIGILLTFVGSLVLIFGFMGLINFDIFAFGISAGVRIVGTLAIAGCLLAAIGCFWLEFK